MGRSIGTCRTRSFKTLSSLNPLVPVIRTSPSSSVSFSRRPAFPSFLLFMVMAWIPHKVSGEAITEKLKCGIAHFELVSSPVRSISALNSLTCPATFSINCGGRFFARIGRPLGDGSPAFDKVERYSVQRITGDGRCLFRALVKGMAFNRGLDLRFREERDEADDLRMAVKEVICDSEERHQYEEAIIAITIDEPLKRYCQRIQRPDFWGGESELLVLSKLCKQRIIVYIPEEEHRRSGGSGGFIPIAEYGAELCKKSRNERQKKTVRLLYSGNNHYDLLV